MIRPTLTLLCLFSLTNYVSAQDEWKLDGNNVQQDAKIGTENPYDLIIETNQQERVRVDKYGNVGIGVSTPQHRLDVLGSTRLNGTLYLPLINQSANFRSTPLYVDAMGQLRSANELFALESPPCELDNNNELPLPFWNSQSTSSAGLIHVGSHCPVLVGIGTDQPTHTLDVNGSIRASNRFVLGHETPLYGTHKCAIYGESSLNYPLFALTAFGQTEFNKQSDGDEPIAIFNSYSSNSTQPTGTVSIHSAGSLNIEHSTQSARDPFTISVKETSQVLATIRQNGSFGLYYTGANEDLIFYSRNPLSGEYNFAIDGNGKIWCQGVIVRNPPFWPDFVFSKNYELIPLNEVKQYIDEHSRLPGLPSAQEINDRGLELEKTITLQMQKIEELTLYIIDLHQRITQLEKNYENK